MSLIAAHRGGDGGTKAPRETWENRRKSFQRAFAQGETIIELDVHLTQDGVPVVIHDPTLERTHGINAAIKDMRREDLPDDIPTLDEVLTMAKRNAIKNPETQVLIELKSEYETQYPPSKATDTRDDETTNRENRMATHVADIISEMEMEKHVTTISFNHDLLDKITQRNEDIKTGLLFDRSNFGWGEASEVTNAMRDEARPIMLNALQKRQADALLPYHALLDAQLGSAVPADKTFATWTVNNESALKRAQAAGADIIISDRPESIRQLIDRSTNPPQPGHGY